MSSPEEPPTKPTATDGEPANERGTPQPADGGQGAADTKADEGRASGQADAGGGQPGSSQSGPSDGHQTADRPGAPTDPGGAGPGSSQPNPGDGQQSADQLSGLADTIGGQPRSSQPSPGGGHQSADQPGVQADTSDSRPASSQPGPSDAQQSAGQPGGHADAGGGQPGSSQPDPSDGHQSAERPGAQTDVGGARSGSSQPNPSDGRQNADQTEPGDGQLSAGQADAGEGQPATDGADGDGAEIPQLSPIPPGGTSAPVDTQRVFGRAGQPFAGAPAPGEPGAGWQRSAPGGQATPEAQPTEADLKRIRSLGRWGLACGIISLLGLLFPPFAIMLAVAAIVVGIMARRLARRKSVFSPGAVPAIVLGIVSMMISAVIVVGIAALWPEARAYMTCVEGANTHSAQAKCELQFKESLEKRGLVTEPQ